MPGLSCGFSLYQALIGQILLQLIEGGTHQVGYLVGALSCFCSCSRVSCASRLPSIADFLLWHESVAFVLLEVFGREEDGQEDMLWLVGEEVVKGGEIIKSGVFLRDCFLSELSEISRSGFGLGDGNYAS